MSHRSVELIVGKLLTDESFRRRFCADPATAVALLEAEGIKITSVELQALCRINPELARRFADALDPRIQKIDPAGEPS